MKKKILYSILLLVIGISIVGCFGGGSDSSGDKKSEEEKKSAWAINKDALTIAIPPEAANAYNEAIRNYSGNSIAPIALLAKQEGSDKYLFLCKETSGEETKFIVVTIAKNEQGEREFAKNIDFDFYSYIEADIPKTQDLVDGWGINSDSGYADLDPDVFIGFVYATTKTNNTVYTPIALIAKNKDNKNQYAFLCLEEVLGETKSTYSLKMLTVDIESSEDAKILNSAFVDLSKYI